MITLKETATRLSLSGPPGEIEHLLVSFRYRPANYWMSDAYQLFKSTGGKSGWDGYLYPMRRLTWGHGQPTTAEIPRGYLDDVLERIKRYKFGVDDRELLIRPFAGISTEDIPKDIVKAEFELDEHQLKCVAAWLESVIGINYVTVSGGKTVMFAAAAAMIKRRYPNARFLYFTQSERLVRQVHSELAKFLPDWHITRYGGGGNDSTGKDIVVATGAKLNRNFKQLKNDGWFKTFMGVLVDEVHHAASPTWSKILAIMPSFFRLGASDTMCEEDPVRWNTIRGLVGPVRRKIEARQLIKDVAMSLASSGRLAKPHIFLVDVPEWSGRFRNMPHTPEIDTPAFALIGGVWKKGLYVGPVYEGDPDSPDGIKRDKAGEPIKLDNYHRLLLDGVEREVESRWCLLERTRDQAIIRFNERNRLIAQWSKHYSDKGWPTLVVCTPTLHILILQSLISKEVGKDKVKILYSEHDSKERDEVFAWLASTPGAVLISSLVKEGVSLPEIRGGVIADYVCGWELARQCIGRFVRKKATDNFANITMFIERQHPKLLVNSIKMLDKLSKTRGFSFYHPVSNPESIPQATLFAEH